MSTTRAILLGGTCDGLECHPFRDQHVIQHGGSTYVRTQLRDGENRQIYAAMHCRTLRQLRGVR